VNLKLQVVCELEGSHLSTYAAQRKYGIQSRSTLIPWLRKFSTSDWKSKMPQLCQRHQDNVSRSCKIKLLERVWRWFVKSPERSLIFIIGNAHIPLTICSHQINCINRKTLKLKPTKPKLVTALRPLLVNCL
jgi:hypothetical protein